MTGIYLSVPFCRQKCTYCNFASGVFPRRLVTPYMAALRSEIEEARPPTEPDTLYLGGGTPSLLKSDELAWTLEPLRVSEWREATIEASPGTITRQKAETWAGLGICRVSLGVQSLVPEEIRATGRQHTPGQVAEEIALLRQAGIASINIDLIAGLAHQTEASWHRSLDWIERLEPRHVSVYMLEVDDESRLGEQIRAGGRRYGARDTPSEDAVADFYLIAVDRLTQMGIRRYEISNFARPGYESAHNLKYWNMEPYLGFGADAHSFDGLRRWRNVESAAEYVARFEAGQNVRQEVEEFDGSRRLEERFFAGLRQTRGVKVSDRELELFQSRLATLTADGWIEQTADGYLRLTDSGVMLSNNVLEQFLLERG